MFYGCIYHTHQGKLRPKHPSMPSSSSHPNWLPTETNPQRLFHDLEPSQDPLPPALLFCCIPSALNQMTACHAGILRLATFAPTQFAPDFKMLLAPLSNFILEACKERSQHLIVGTGGDCTKRLQGTNRVVIFLFPF